MKLKVDVRILKCIACNSGNLQQLNDKLICADCKKEYLIENNLVVFVNLEDGNVTDELDKIKYILKKFNLAVL